VPKRPKGSQRPWRIGIEDYTNFRGSREQENVRSDVGNQGLSGLVMLIPRFVGPDPKRRFASVNYCIANGSSAGCWL